MKQPAFQFYPGDWMKDPNLRRCSLAARGAMIDILCLMFECTERGVLITAGRPWSLDEIAGAIVGNADVTLPCVIELLDKGVLRRRPDGAVYSCRMIRDEKGRAETRKRVRKHRKNSANAHNCAEEGECNDKCNGDVTVMKRPSSSSSSSSPSGEHRAREGPGDGEIPSVDEVIEFGRASPGVPEWFARHYHEQKSIKRTWLNGFGRLIDWRRELCKWFAADGRPAAPPGRAVKGGGADSERQKRIRQIDAELDYCTGEERAKLKDERKALSAGGVV